MTNPGLGGKQRVSMLGWRFLLPQSISRSHQASCVRENLQNTTMQKRNSSKILRVSKGALQNSPLSRLSILGSWRSFVSSVPLRVAGRFRGSRGPFSTESLFRLLGVQGSASSGSSHSRMPGMPAFRVPRFRVEGILPSPLALCFPLSSLPGIFQTGIAILRSPTSGIARTSFPYPRRAISTWHPAPRILPAVAWGLSIGTARTPRKKTPPGDAQDIWGSSSSPVTFGMRRDRCCTGREGCAHRARWTREFPLLLPPPSSSSSPPLRKIRQLQKLSWGSAAHLLALVQWKPYER